MPAKVRYPSNPSSGYIAGWYVAEGPESVRDQLIGGTATAKDYKRLATYVTQLAKWVEQEEKRLRKQGDL